jgi:hypothetical protein
MLHAAGISLARTDEREGPTKSRTEHGTVKVDKEKDFFFEKVVVLRIVMFVGSVVLWMERIEKMEIMGT